LRVEGHTDKRPIHTARYPSNWDLSADRALKVISYIRSTELLDPNKLACVGYGEERPLIDEETPEAYAKNRRVEFVAETAPQLRR
ncbi:MAG: OmpA family protein, partial [Oscillospiraceae bacterium]|nr:OmpA family protein [Oscillospiraceae bacterium]